MSRDAETCPPRDTSPIPEDWPDCSDSVPLIAFWPHLSGHAKTELKATLALLRQGRHAARHRLSWHCKNCQGELGEHVTINGRTGIALGGVVVHQRVTIFCRVCQRRTQWRPATGPSAFSPPVSGPAETPAAPGNA